MKQKILAKLLAKHTGLQKKFLELLAEKLAKKVQDESGIDAAIAELDNAPISIEDLAADFQRYGDSRVTDAKIEWEKKKPVNDPDDEEDDNDDEEDDNDDHKPKNKDQKNKDQKRRRNSEPKWARELKDEIKALRTEKVQGTFKEKLKERLKDVPESFYKKWKLPENEQELETFVLDAETEYAEFVKDATNKGVAISTTPHRSKETPATGGKVADKQIQADIDKYVQRGKPADAKDKAA